MVPVLTMATPAFTIDPYAWQRSQATPISSRTKHIQPSATYTDVSLTATHRSESLGPVLDVTGKGQHGSQCQLRPFRQIPRWVSVIGRVFGDPTYAGQGRDCPGRTRHDANVSSTFPGSYH